MKKNKNAESLVWIVIGVFILWFVLVWIMSILSFNKDISNSYTKEISSYVLQWNSENIMKKLDLSKVNNWDTFYIYKNETTKEFEVLTWSINESYKYIDSMWNNVDPTINIWKTYVREFIKDIDILKHTIQPSEIADIVFHLDATNIDSANNATLIEATGSVDTWDDLSWNSNNWTAVLAEQPIYVKDWINWLTYIKFDWTDDRLDISNDILINTGATYPEKTISLVFKTWFDIQSTQIIYEQWGSTNWYSIQIDGWGLYAWVWHTSWSDEQYKIVDLWIVVPDSTYFIMMIQNSSYWNDTDNNLQVYLNWELINTLNNVDIQTDHTDAIGIWKLNGSTLRLSNNNNLLSSSPLNEWWIWELISWNHALSKDEINWINQYFLQKWLNWKENVYYNVVKTNVKKYQD